MVIQLLPFGRLCAEQSAAAEAQILAFQIIGFVDEKILLLRADSSHNPLDIRLSEQLQNAQRLHVDGFHRAKQRRLFVQSLAAIGAEGRGDAEDAVLDKGIRGGVPCGVAPGLKRSPQAAGGEAGGIRLALDELFAGKFHDDVAVLGGGNKAVVLFGRYPGHGLEPMGEVCDAFADGPILHGIGNDIRHRKIQGFSLFNRLFHGFVGIFGEAFLHRLVVKYQASK